MIMLNLGCGSQIHPDWINIDLATSTPGVISHNLLEGIPYKNDSVDVVYHSHVLEHFPLDKGEWFLGECFRVLRPGGIIRVVVPDLESIVKSYCEFKKAAEGGDPIKEANYDWILLELYDQTVRNKRGGMMAERICETEAINHEFILERMGQEAQKILYNSDHGASSLKLNWKGRLYMKFQKLKSMDWFYKLLLGREDWENLELGRFRNSGEVHMWMYDDFSLSRTLKKVGFQNINRVDGHESSIPHWSQFGLDTKSRSNQPRKPDSLFMEAIKQ
ncbi:MAG: methyltransferase domain-containing protein [Planctomycetota bacterium]|nr:MAG: methyltransferase domain-containing protein [Planctomycetota bacterium]